MSQVRTLGYRRVKATPEEIAAYQVRCGSPGCPSTLLPSVERSVHEACGTRIWHSGLGVGSHNRACKTSSMSPQEIDFLGPRPTAAVLAAHRAQVQA